MIGSSFDLRVEMDHVGVIRRSAETSGFDLGSLGSERTVMRRGISCGVCSDMFVASAERDGCMDIDGGYFVASRNFPLE